MINFRNKKNKKIMMAVIVGILVVCMVLPMLASIATSLG